eukprot:TRINITY_DN2891_c0_g1_i1.p2 TRINITY_DN2891_c0_g1~~TRINITY_DN2891_c0_g1_i1.p2  ORF type:complete len:216 (-),score=42.33 TRINITY_DN2891_c0_g1_i1:217-864(-)
MLHLIPYALLGTTYLSVAGLIPAALKVVRSRDPTILSYAEIVFSYYSYAIWTFYGHVSKNETIMNLCSAGVMLYLVYLVVYLIYAKEYAKIVYTNCVIMNLVWLLNRNDHSYVKYAAFVALIARFLASVWTMRGAMRSGVTKRMHNFEIVTTLMNCIVWAMFGYFVKNYYIMVPHVFGQAIYWMKFGVRFLYKKGKPAPPKKVEKMDQKLLLRIL